MLLCVDDASVGWGTMRPRMGFAPVRIAALRRRQDPCTANELAWMGSRRSQASLHQHVNELCSQTIPPIARLAWVGSPCYRCAWLVRIECMRGLRTTIDPYDRNLGESTPKVESARE